MSDDETRSTEFSDEEVGEDDEATMAEEELNNDDDDADDELRMLNEENEMSVEELRRKYYGEVAVAEVPASNGPAASSSTTGEPTTLFGEDVEEEEEDADYVPKAPEYWKKEVRVGPNYQAEFPLPEVKPSSPKEEVEVLNDSEPLWIPAKLNKKELEDFLVKVSEKLHELEDAEVDTTPQANRKPKYDGITDDEDALFALYKANYDIQKALSKLPYDPANGPRVTAPKKWRPMSKEDADRFEEAFSEHGKNFFKIHKEKMSDRSVGELINFYYVWKKTERHDMYIAARRALGQLEGPKATDPMEVLVDQHLNDSNGTVHSTEPEPAAHKTWLAVPHEPAPEQK